MYFTETRAMNSAVLVGDNGPLPVTVSKKTRLMIQNNITMKSYF